MPGHVGVPGAQLPDVRSPGSVGVAAPREAPDVGRLLAGLQRGNVGGADASVDFLCQKFSALVERLQKAEAGERQFEDTCAEVEAKIATEEQGADTERQDLEVAAIAQREEARRIESHISEVLCGEAETQKQLAAVRAETEALTHRKKSLDELCLTERAKLAETNSRLRQQQLSRPEGKEEIRRLQTQLEMLTARSTAAAADLENLKERARRDEDRLAKLKSDIVVEEEARERAASEAGLHRDEVEQALGELASLQEQLAEHQVKIQRCAGEAQRYGDRRSTIQQEINRRRSWIQEAQRELDGLRDTEQGVELVIADTAKILGKCRVEEEEVRLSMAENASKKAELAAVEEQLSKQSERLAQVERQRDAVKAEAVVAEAEEAKLSAVVEQLRHDQAAGGGMRRNLEQELQIVSAEAEKLRKELATLKAEKVESHQRLQLIAPALHEARRRVRELESQLQAYQAESSHEKALSERLERETDLCQDKLRALRDENVRLSESCTELEAQMLQPQYLRASSGATSQAPTPRRSTSAGLPSWGQRALRQASRGSATPRAGSAGSASAGRLSGSKPARRGGSASSPRRRIAQTAPRTPRLAARAGPKVFPTSEPGFETPVSETGCRGRAAISCEGRAEPTAAPTLLYLRNWIQQEEERLSASSPELLAG